MNYNKFPHCTASFSRYIFITVLIFYLNNANFPSLPVSTPSTIPYWYLPTRLASSLRNNTISPSLMSKLLLNHLGCFVNCGTQDISQLSNQLLNISSLSFRNLDGLPVTNNGPSGLLSLFRPSFSLFGVIKSIFSNSETRLCDASGRSLMELPI